MNEATLLFAEEHLHDDTVKLLLSANRFPGIDIAAAVQQIEGKRTAKEKWPSLASCKTYAYPPRLNREQSSSEATARHKSSIAGELLQRKEVLYLADLTGGMGIDSIALSKIHPSCTLHLDYVECNEELCSLMEWNTQALGITNITTHHSDCLEWIKNVPKHFDLLFIDPARRDAHGKKTSAFEDCTPNIIDNMEALTSKCQWLIVKASPMIDIDLAVSQLKSVVQTHIIAVHGECKEILFICGRSDNEATLHCTDINTVTKTLKFTRSAEQQSTGIYCNGEMGKYLYEPNAALMKGAPYKILSERYNIAKLDRNTHLYTSDQWIPEFPGRTFEIEQPVSLNKKQIAQVIPQKKAHVVSRNYPMTSDEIQKKAKLQEGGEKYIIATTVNHTLQAYLCNKKEPSDKN